jgi:two-component system nitrate/nitrite response regulator NarL
MELHDHAGDELKGVFRRRHVGPWQLDEVDVLDEIARRAGTYDPEVGTEFGPRLTSREWDVLAGLAEGLSTRDIAKRLQLKPSGVRAHISAVVQKLGVKDRHEAVSLFREGTTTS